MASPLRVPLDRPEIDAPDRKVLKGLLIGGGVSILFWGAVLWIVLPWH